MPSKYLQASELANYGVDSATDAQIATASTLIDAYLHRPMGLLWTAGADGQPCYMTAANPSMTLTSQASIAPGQSVVVSLTQAPSFPDPVGEVVILDRATPDATEAAVITGFDRQAKTITLDTVAFAHTGPVTLELGMTLTEERALASKRSITRIGQGPIVRMISGLGRYGYGRRSDQVAGLYNDVNLLATIQSFGGPPQWIPFDVSLISYSQMTNEVWIPAGQLLAYYSEVRLRFVAGYQAQYVPEPIKFATAKLLKGGSKYPQFEGNISKIGSRSGVGADNQMERFAASSLDGDTKQLIERYKATQYF